MEARPDRTAFVTVPSKSAGSVMKSAESSRKSSPTARPGSRMLYLLSKYSRTVARSRTLKSLFTAGIWTAT